MNTEHVVSTALSTVIRAVIKDPAGASKLLAQLDAVNTAAKATQTKPSEAPKRKGKKLSRSAVSERQRLAAFKAWETRRRNANS